MNSPAIFHGLTKSAVLTDVLSFYMRKTNFMVGESSIRLLHFEKFECHIFLTKFIMYLPVSE